MYWVIEFSNKSIPLWSQRIFAVNYDYFTLRSEGDLSPFCDEPVGFTGRRDGLIGTACL
jgi:hypothetical protein